VEQDVAARRLLVLEKTIEERSKRLSALEKTMEERSARLLAVERTLEERSQRIAALEADRRPPFWYQVASTIRRRIRGH
jgi:uncharacterized coiled-coil protein SlyX